MSKYIRNKTYREMLTQKPEWGPIGQITYLRTYSRWLNDQARREHWGETVRRVADYSVSLDPVMTEEERVLEAEKLFETIYKMKAFPAGRTLWVGGTEHSKTHGQSQFNCSFANINSLDDLHDIVVLLMNGVGVGVGVRSDEVAKFASQGTLNLNKQVVIKDYEYVGTPGTGGAYDKSDRSAFYTIHDSREGWAEFVRDFMGELLFAQDTDYIYVNLDHIRPEGTKLKTFGGRASGPQAVVDFIDGILQISHGMTEINDIFLLDTANLLGRMVVAGGTRRSALIALGDADSVSFENAKVGDWCEDRPWRGQANNSKVFYSKPSKESIRNGFKKILQYGEPAFVNGFMAKSIRRDWAGLNPCFAGDMRLLTEDGWVTFKDAYEHGKPLNIIQDSRVTYEGEGEEKPEHWKIDPENTDLPVVTQASHVFLTKRDADIVKLEFANGATLRCTPDHLIATTIGMVEARNLSKYHDVLVHRVARCDKIVGERPQTVEQHRAYALGALSVSGRYGRYSNYIDLWWLKKLVQESIEAGYGERLSPDLKGTNISTDEVKRVTGYDPLDLIRSDVPEWISNNADDKVGSWFIRGFLSTGLEAPYEKDKDQSYHIDIVTKSTKMLHSIRHMLKERGIDAECTLVKEGHHYEPTYWGDPGYYQPEYSLKILSDIDMCMSAIGVDEILEDYKSERSTTDLTRLVSITPDGREDVYCIKEDTRRTVIVEGIVAKRCAEILLSDKGFCVSGDTQLITRNGLVKISDVVGVETDIWNGQRWSTVKPFFTGGDKDLYRVTFSDGSYLDVTGYHRFSAETKKSEWRNSFVEKTTLQMIDELEEGKTIRMQPFTIEWTDGIDVDEAYAYTVGLYAADGTCERDGGSRSIELYGAKMSLPTIGKKTASVRPKGYNVDKCTVIGLPFTKQESLEYKKSIDMVFTWSKKAALAYLAGLIDGDGSSTVGGGVRLYISGREKASKLQLLVRKLGMRSSLNIMSKKGDKTNYGTRKEDMCYLQITECNNIPCNRVDTSRGHTPTTKGVNQIVKTITKLEGKHDTYCFTEPEFGMGVFGNTLTYQCNLVSINLKYFADHGNDDQMLKDTVEIITRHNLRITNTTIQGVDPEWDIVQKRDRLLGVSFTGYGDHADILGEDVSLETLGKMRKWVRDQANSYADKMGIPHPLLATTVKPEGTITLLYGASSGIHDAYAPYYIRRMRMSRTDALAVVLTKMGVPVEDDLYAPQTVVFSFPIKSAAKKAASEKSAVEQLERYKNIMQTYVDHNASNTIYIDESEVDEVTDWLYDNWDSYVAVSFLPKFGKYEQAPMEEINEETYNRLAAQMPDLSDLHARLAEVEYEMSAGDELEGCETGSCPVR